MAWAFFKSCRRCAMARLLRIQFCCTGVCVDVVGESIVAAFVQAPKIKPDFGDVGIDADTTRVGIESVTVLIDLKIKHANEPSR